jgi:hypothetical protein
VYPTADLLIPRLEREVDRQGRWKAKDGGTRQRGEDRQGRLRIRQGRWESPRGTKTEREKPIRRTERGFNGTVGEVRRVVSPVLLDVPTRRFSAIRHALKRNKPDTDDL